MEILNGIIFFGLFIIILFYIKYTWNQTKYLEVKKEDFLDQPKLKYGFLPSNYAENSEYHLNPPIIKVKESNNDNNDNDNDNDNYAQYISDNSSAINGCIKDFIDSHTLSYSDVKDNENYYHDQHCMISLTKFYSNDNVLVFDCNHYLKINRKNRNSLSTMYRNKLSIFCPKCRYVHLSLKPTESI